MGKYVTEDDLYEMYEAINRANSRVNDLNDRVSELVLQTAEPVPEQPWIVRYYRECPDPPEDGSSLSAFSLWSRDGEPNVLVNSRGATYKLIPR